MRRRSSVITLITLIVVLMVGGFLAYQQRRAMSRPPVVQREVRGTVAGVAPAPEFLLRHQREVQLTADQRERVQQIATRYRRDVAPAEARLEAASRQYQQYLTQTEARKPSTKDLAERGAEVSRLSGVIAATRHSYWQQARSVLTPPQQAKVDKLVESATLRDLS